MSEHSAAGQEPPSIGQLLAEVTSDLSTLVRQEIALAKAEAREQAKTAGGVAGSFTGAAVAGQLVLVFLSVALWWGLGNAIGRGWSGLVVALLWAVVAAVLALVGRKRARDLKGLPRTKDSLQHLPDAARGNEPGHDREPSDVEVAQRPASR
jgi:hypothetical protein